MLNRTGCNLLPRITGNLSKKTPRKRLEGAFYDDAGEKSLIFLCPLLSPGFGCLGLMEICEHPIQM